MSLGMRSVRKASDSLFDWIARLLPVTRLRRHTNDRSDAPGPSNSSIRATMDRASSVKAEWTLPTPVPPASAPDQIGCDNLKPLRYALTYAAGGGSLSPRSGSVCKAEGSSNLLHANRSLSQRTESLAGAFTAHRETDFGRQRRRAPIRFRTVFVSRRDRERAITPAPHYTRPKPRKIEGIPRRRGTRS